MHVSHLSLVIANLLDLGWMLARSLPKKVVIGVQELITHRSWQAKMGRWRHHLSAGSMNCSVAHNMRDEPPELLETAPRLIVSVVPRAILL